jgi:hypothetical protein
VITSYETGEIEVRPAAAGGAVGGQTAPIYEQRLDVIERDPDLGHVADDSGG